MDEVKPEVPGAIAAATATDPVLRGKKILFVVNHAEFFLSHRLPLAQAARGSGMDVAIATSATPGVEKLRAHGFKVHLLPLAPGGMNPFRDLALLWALVRLYSRERPDLVHQVTIKPVMYGGIAARLTGVPAVVSAMSGLGFLYISNALWVRLLRVFLSLPLRLALQGRRVRLILQNPDDVTLFLQRRLVQPEQIVQVPGSGVDELVYTVKPEPEGAITVLFPARLLWDKGIAEYVEAARELKGRHPKVRFLVAGASDCNNPRAVPEADVQAWVREGVIEWLGQREDMPVLFAASHVICLPSYREGLPKALIEAASCGRAIVTTDVPGCREIVQPGLNGFRVPVRNARALAVALEKLLESAELRRNMAHSGRQLVLKKFTLKAVVAQTLSLYRQSLARI